MMGWLAAVRRWLDLREANRCRRDADYYARQGAQCQQVATYWTLKVGDTKAQRVAAYYAELSAERLRLADELLIKARELERASK